MTFPSGRKSYSMGDYIDPRDWETFFGPQQIYWRGKRLEEMDGESLVRARQDFARLGVPSWDEPTNEEMSRRVLRRIDECLAGQ